MSPLPAGNFSEWLRGAEKGFQAGKGGAPFNASVPCGGCRGCCRSSMFIHIKPDEIATMQRIPRALLFPAPGLPKGHMLMGYDDQGQCPMLIANECSIYEHRPQTCRDYDCRVFAATGVAVDEPTQAEIAQRVKAWAFAYENNESREEHSNVKAAARFLQENRELFPQGAIPAYPVQLAALAVRIYRLFARMTPTKQEDPSATPDAIIASAIIGELNNQTHSGKR